MTSKRSPPGGGVRGRGDVTARGDLAADDEDGYMGQGSKVTANGKAEVKDTGKEVNLNDVITQTWQAPDGG